MIWGDSVRRKKMKTKKIIKIIVDTAMLILLPLLMAYSLIGETTHEWLGLTMLLLFILHHIMNPAWLRTLFKGRYTPLLIYITSVNILLLIIMVLQPVSGILMSKHIFHFSGVGGMSFTRTIHLLLAHWGFILMSIHVGNHVGVHCAGKKSGATILWVVVIAVSIYGAYTFVNRDMASYLLLKNQFVFEAGNIILSAEEAANIAAQLDKVRTSEVFGGSPVKK